MAKMFAANGAKLYIGPAKAYSDVDFTAADFPKTGGSAITWTEVTGVQSIGSVGDTAELVSATHLGSSRQRKMKGARNAGSMAVVCSLDLSDPGQIALVAAEKAAVSYAVRIVFNDAPAGGTPSERFFTGFVMSSAEEVGEANSVVTLNATLEIDSNIVRVAAAA